MKKTILTIMVAAMMLVAFTACEQPVPGLSKAIVDADIVQNGTFFVGQPFDASKFSVNVTYSDGSKGTLDGVNVLYDGTSSSKDASSVVNGAVVTVTLPTAAPNYSGSNVETKDTTFKGSLVAYAFNNVTVTGTESLPYDTTEKEFIGDLELSVVATYKDSEGATQSVTLVENEDYTVNEPTATTAPTSTADGVGKAVIVLKYGGYKLSGVSANNVEYEFVATVYDGPDPEYTYKWTEKIYYTIAEDTGSYVNRGLFNASEVVTLYKQMQAYDEDGTAVSPAIYKYEAIPYDDDLEVELSSPLATTDGSVRFPESGDATVTFMYRESDAAGKYTPYSTATNGLKVNADGELEADTTQGAAITIDLRLDYPTYFDVSWIGAGGVSGAAYNTTASAATVDKAKDFTYTITWKSGFAGVEQAKYISAITADKTSIAQNTPSGSETVNFTYKINDATAGYVDSDLTASASVTVQGPATI